MFLPALLPAGIEPADPMIQFRNKTYPVSYERRHQSQPVRATAMVVRDWRRKPPMPLRVTKKLDAGSNVTRCPHMRAVAIAPFVIRTGRLAGYAVAAPRRGRSDVSGRPFLSSRERP